MLEASVGCARFCPLAPVDALAEVTSLVVFVEGVSVGLFAELMLKRETDETRSGIYLYCVNTYEVVVGSDWTGWLEAVVVFGFELLGFVGGVATGLDLKGSIRIVTDDRMHSRIGLAGWFGGLIRRIGHARSNKRTEDSCWWCRTFRISHRKLLKLFRGAWRFAPVLNLRMTHTRFRQMNNASFLQLTEAQDEDRLSGEWIEDYYCN